MISSKRITSTQEALALLNCQHFPARLNTTETAVLLGFQEHDIPVLVTAKLLSPLGKPAPNAPKYFATVDIQECARNREWLDQATKMLAKHWHRKNHAKLESKSSLLPGDA